MKLRERELPKKDVPMLVRNTLVAVSITALAACSSFNAVGPKDGSVVALAIIYYLPS